MEYKIGGLKREQHLSSGEGCSGWDKLEALTVESGIKLKHWL